MMMHVKILEIKSDQNFIYKTFLKTGLTQDEESFRITPADDKDSRFPTNDTIDSFTLGAYCDSRLAGVVSFTRDGSDREKLRHKGILFRMYISPEFRGMGLSKKLIIELTDRVRGIETIEQINLTVITSNETARKTYEKIGFKKFATEKNAIKWKGKYFDEDQMALSLSS